jgi:hypothetical protein
VTHGDAYFRKSLHKNDSYEVIKNSVTLCHLSPGRTCGIETLFVRQASHLPSKENVAPGVHPGGGGVNPTVALQSSITGEVSRWRKQFNPGIVCICSRILRDRQTSSSYWAALVTATRVVAAEPMVLSWRIPVAQHYLRGTISVGDPIVS